MDGGTDEGMNRPGQILRDGGTDNFIEMQGQTDRRIDRRTEKPIHRDLRSLLRGEQGEDEKEKEKT